jgi:VWFA-related protein
MLRGFFLRATAHCRRGNSRQKLKHSTAPIPAFGAAGGLHRKAELSRPMPRRKVCAARAWAAPASVQAGEQGRFAMKKVACRAVLMMLVAGLLRLPLAAADEYTIRASTKEVRLAFAASDRRGAPVRSLAPDDVAVTDNGWIIRNFRSFSPASESVLELIVLIDASDSLAAELPREIAEAEALVKETAWGERDRVSILVFGGPKPQLICARNCHASAAQPRLDQLRTRGLTPLYDAVLTAAEILQQGHDPEARPAMILFSDGMDNFSMHSLPEALRAAQQLQAAIYCFNTRNPKHGGSGDAVMDYLAEMSGGLSYAPGEKMRDALHAVMDDLHSGFLLTYRLPAERTGEHEVRVVPARDPRLQFRSRRAYNDGE